MRLTGGERLAIALASMMGCQSPSVSTLTVLLDIEVKADTGAPLSDVPVLVDNELKGRSDSDGSLRVALSGEPGRKVLIEHHCPDGHRASGEPKALRLRGYHEDGAGLLIELECRPEKRLAAFAIKATNGPYITVLLNGEVVARTNGAGVAHFSRSGPAGTEYLVQLDATEHPGLLPRKTSHLFTLPDSNELFLVEQTFESRKRAGKPRFKRRRIIKIE